MWPLHKFYARMLSWCPRGENSCAVTGTAMKGGFTLSCAGNGDRAMYRSGEAAEPVQARALLQTYTLTMCRIIPARLCDYQNSCA